MSQVSVESSRAPAGGVGALYRATRKPGDVWFNTYVCRPLAALIVYALRDTRVAPNQVTFFSLALALGGAACLILLRWPLGLWLGVAVYELSYVFDKVDGMLARYRGVQSATGHLLDFLMDEIKAFVILAAAATGAFLATGRVDFLFWGLGGVVALASGIGITTFVRRPEVAAESAAQRGAPAVPAEGGEAPRARRGVVGIAERIGKFFIHYPSYIWLAAVLGDVRVFLYPYVAVNVLYAARSMLGLLLRYGHRAPRARAG